MTGLDTNVLIRHITQDDPLQSATATNILRRRFTESAPGFVTIATLMETVWVLESFYGLSASRIASAIEQVLQAETLLVQNESEVFLALYTLRSGRGSFEDALIGELGIGAGCETTLTFDRKASRLRGFELIA